MKLLQVTFVGIILCSCAGNSNEFSKSTDRKILITKDQDEVMTQDKIDEYLLAETQDYSIIPNKDTLLKCEQGTLIYLPANSLEHKDGSKLTGSVDLKIKECYDLSDIIGESLETSSDGRILETGGMVKIDATSEGKELVMKKGKEYALYFPKDPEKKEEMSLFLGNEPKNGVVDWTLAPQTTNQTRPRFERNPRVSIAPTIRNDSIICKDISKESKEFGRPSWKLKNSDETAISYINENLKIPEKLLANRIVSRVFPSYNIYFNKEGNVEKVLSAQECHANNLIKKFLFNLPPLDVSIFRNDQVSRMYSLRFEPVDGASLNYLKTKAFEAKYETFMDQAVEEIGSDELDYYILSATNFGWINCDHFPRMTEPLISYSVIVRQPNKTKINLVFEDLNSIMGGSYANGKIVFNNVPLGKKVKIIGISSEGKSTLLGIANTSITHDPLVLNDFKTFTLNELKKELNSIQAN